MNSIRILISFALLWPSLTFAWEADPQFQAKLEEIAVVLAADPDLEADFVDEHLATLLQAADDNRAKVLRHLFHNISIGWNDESKAHLVMGLVGLFYRLNATDDEIVDAAATLLTDDNREVLGEFLLEVENNDGSEQSNFQPYVAYIQHSNNAEARRNLIRYMMERNPVAGLQSTMDALNAQGPQHTTLESALALIEPSFEKREIPFIRLRFPEEQIAIQETLADLATHAEWWVRLFVSEIIRQSPLLGSQELKGVLESDADPFVKASIAEFEPLRVLSRPEMRDAIQNRPSDDPLYVSALSDFLPTCSEEELDFLLRSARSKGGWSIMINLGRSLRERALEGEAALADHFIDSVAQELTRSGAKVNPAFCVGGLGRLANLGDPQTLEGIRPYGFDRITEIILSTLDHPHLGTRREAIMCLGDVIRFDAQTAQEVSARLTREREHYENDPSLGGREKQVVVRELDAALEELAAPAPN